MKRLLLLLFPIASVSISLARSETGKLSGIVIAENAPLELASVSLLKTSFAASAGKLGEFLIDAIPPGKYQLRVSFLGYENFQTEISITTGHTTAIKAELIPLTSKLKEIVVTGTMKEVKKLESITPVDVYRPKYFLRNPCTNIFDAISNVNGVFADIDNGVSNTTDVQLNGLEGNYTMVLIDGVPAMNGLAGLYALTALPMSIIDKVEILKGASSTLYGSDAIGGVINIKTKQPSATPRLAIDASLSSMLEANADISASFKLKRVSTFFAVSAAASDYRWDMDEDGFMDIPLVNRANFFNKWSFNRSDNKIANIYFRYLFEDRLGGQLNLPGRSTGGDRYYSEWIRTYQWQAGWQYQLPIREKVMIQTDYSEHRQTAYYAVNYFKGIQRNAFAQITWNKIIDERIEMLFGATYRLNYYSDNTGISADQSIGSSKFSHFGGVFMEYEFSLPLNQKLLTGIRFDYNSRSGPMLAPRINYKWNSKNEKNVLRVGAGTGYRVPNLLNEGFAALNGSRQILVSEKLKPELAISGNANYTRVQDMNGGVLNLDASVFYTYFFNFINPDYSEQNLIIYKNNTNGATSTGFSLNADFTFNYPMKIGIGMTYAKVFEIEKSASGEKEMETPLHAPPFIANFYLSYNFPVPQLSIDWTGNLVSPMNLSTVPDDYRPSKSPWFTIQNIQLTKKFTSGIEIYLGLKNFFNFIQKEPILRPFDPFNRQTAVDNPYNYTFDTTYGFTSTQGIKAFAGLRYTLQ